MTKLKALESCPDSWNDDRLMREMGNIMERTVTLPPPPESEDPNRYYCKQIGQEVDGIRCIVSPCLSTLIGDEFDFVALDEAHKIQNMDALTTQMAIRLRPKYRYPMSATPISNVVSNLFPLMGWTAVEDWYKGGRRNAAWPYAREELVRFVDTFQSVERDFTQEDLNEANAKKNGNNKYSRSKCIKVSPIISAPARLLKILKPSMAYISKPMCSSSYKEPTLVDVRVPMGEQQMNLYVHFMNRGNISGHPLIRARKQITYLRNICADPMGFTHGGPKVTSNFNPKTAAILELTRDILAKGDQVVIVCARKGQTDTLHFALRDAGVLVSRIDSTISAEQHSHQSNLFKAHKTQVHLMGIKCAMGHSYNECPYMIIGSLEYSYGSLEQARGRIDRVNSKKPATIYCVLHKHSLEEVMYSVVATKEDAATICLQGRRIPRNFKPIDMSEILANAITNFSGDGVVPESFIEKQWPELRDRISQSIH